MTIYEYLEDFDNPEISDWGDIMEEAILNWDEEHIESHKISAIIRNYKSWKREKYASE